MLLLCDPSFCTCVMVKLAEEMDRVVVLFFVIVDVDDSLIGAFLRLAERVAPMKRNMLCIFFGAVPLRSLIKRSEERGEAGRQQESSMTTIIICCYYSSVLLQQCCVCDYGAYDDGKNKIMLDVIAILISVITVIERFFRPRRGRSDRGVILIHSTNRGILF